MIRQPSAVLLMLVLVAMGCAGVPDCSDKDIVELIRNMVVHSDIATEGEDGENEKFVPVDISVTAITTDGKDKFSASCSGTVGYTQTPSAELKAASEPMIASLDASIKTLDSTMNALGGGGFLQGMMGMATEPAKATRAGLVKDLTPVNMEIKITYKTKRADDGSKAVSVLGL